MDDARVVGRREPLPCRDGESENLDEAGPRSGLMLHAPSRERPRFDVLHRDVDPVPLDANVTDRQDIGVLELRERLSLAHEPSSHRLVRATGDVDEVARRVCGHRRSLPGPSDFAHSLLALTSRPGPSHRAGKCPCRLGTSRT